MHTRVPRFTPSAPSASTAASCEPVAIPPEAMKGTWSCLAAEARSTRLPTSSRPGWPAHSKPSTERMSTPYFSALRAWRTDVHLWMQVTPAALACLMMPSSCLPPLPAVSITGTRSSAMIRANPSYGGGRAAGRIVRFTPKGLSPQSLLASRIHARPFSTISSSVFPPALWIAKMPRPPASETAAASCGVPTPVMPPITMGYLMPSSSVTLVFIGGATSARCFVGWTGGYAFPFFCGDQNCDMLGQTPARGLPEK
mmetsp:Transcript_11156/g.35359  ORF Transcript_11156/g.35359 Transcript_11156/m.35359 type:complete len:255 (-) Transcript_11156:15-779(-)